MYLVIGSANIGSCVIKSIITLVYSALDAYIGCISLYFR
jgi:hypothetical protein